MNSCEYCWENEAIEIVDSYELCEECIKYYDPKFTYCSLHCAMGNKCTGDCIENVFDDNL